MSHPALLQAVAPGVLPRHRHEIGYAAVVLDGAYEEAGDNGRRRLCAGDVVAHGPWEAHLNRTAKGGARVLNLPLPPEGLQPFGRVIDPDTLVRTAERDPRDAVAALLEGYVSVQTVSADWPDILAEAVAAGDRRPLADWAARLGVSPEQLSRGFRKAYGVTPQRYRWEVRSRAALRGLASSASLAELALVHGFADQAHLTRSLRDFAGAPPGALRRSIAFKTGA